MNTIFGFGGTMDIAAQYKTVVPATGEDLGQTLGVWGIGKEGIAIDPYSAMRDGYTPMRRGDIME